MALIAVLYRKAIGAAQGVGQAAGETAEERVAQARPSGRCHLAFPDDLTQTVWGWG